MCKWCASIELTEFAAKAQNILDDPAIQAYLPRGVRKTLEMAAGLRVYAEAIGYDR